LENLEGSSSLGRILQIWKSSSSIGNIFSRRMQAPLARLSLESWSPIGKICFPVERDPLARSAFMLKEGKICFPFERDPLARSAFLLKEGKICFPFERDPLARSAFLLKETLGQHLRLWCRQKCRQCGTSCSRPHLKGGRAQAFEARLPLGYRRVMQPAFSSSPPPCPPFPPFLPLPDVSRHLHPPIQGHTAGVTP